MSKNNKKFYYPEILDQINLKFIIKTNKIDQPFKGLEYFYLKHKNNFLHIPSNTQLSEFLNKFNESYILVKLSEYYFKNLKSKNQKIEFLEEMVNDFGWNWMNWNSEKGKKVIKQLELINQGSLEFNNLTRDTKKILGHLKLKESTDYGKKTEKDINIFLKEETHLKSWEVENFLMHLSQNNLVVIGTGRKFLDPEGLITGEIDFILMNKETKNIHICDLKTSAEADKTDYWRQVLVYKKIIKKLNPKIKHKISDDLIIIHINKNKKISNFYIKNFNNTELEKMIDQLLNIKENYLKLI